LEKKYVLPDQKKNPVGCLVLAYKVTKGVPHDDRTWDAAHWARSSKSAKALLGICGGLRQADSCLIDIAKGFEAKELSWTLETVVKHAHDWIAKKRGPINNAAHTYRTRLFAAIAEQRGSEGRSEDSKEVGKVLDSIRSDANPRQADAKNAEPNGRRQDV